MDTLRALTEQYIHIAKKWDEARDNLPYIITNEPKEGAFIEDDKQFIEVASDGKMSLKYTERGNIDVLMTTHSIDEFLYFLFKSEAEAYGRGYAMQHLSPELNFRKVYFQKAVERMGTLSEEWQNRLQEELNEILIKHP